MSQLSPWIASQGETVYFSSARIKSGKVSEVDVYTPQPMESLGVFSGSGVIAHIIVFGGFAADVLMKLLVDKATGDSYVVAPCIYQVGTPGAGAIAVMNSYKLSNFAASANLSQYPNAFGTVLKPDTTLFHGAEIEFVLPAGAIIRINSKQYAGQSSGGAGTTQSVLPYRVIYDDMTV